MGRYQVTISKDSYESKNSQSLHLEVADLESSVKSRRIFGNFADFNILEPLVHFVRIEALKNYKEGFSKEVSPASSSSLIKNVQDKTNTQFYYKQGNYEKLVTYSNGLMDSKNTPLWPTGKDYTDLDLRGEGSFIEVNALDLSTDARVILKVLVDKVIDLNCKENLEDANKNDPVCSGESTPIHIPVDTDTIAGNPLENVHVNHEEQKIEENAENGNENLVAASKNSVVIAVGNVLIIRIELEKCLPGKPVGQQKDALNNNSNEQLTEDNTAVLSNDLNIFPEPRTEIEFPELHTSLIAGDFIQERTIQDEKKKLEHRAVQKDILKILIFERLKVLGLPWNEAQGITIGWHKGYIQHRPFSYRITNTEHLVSGIELAPNLLESQKFALQFIRHTEILQGILDSATCTVIEATFFLMLPHLKMQQQEQNVCLAEAVNNQKFMKDWVQVIFAIAHQLKPIKPISVRHLIKKETKLIGKPLASIQKVTQKIKHKSIDVQRKIEKLRKKLLQRIEPHPEWMNEVLHKKPNKKLPEEEDFERLQLPENMSASNIFENSMHIGIADHGLLIKQKVEDKWFSFSNLNFKERRVLFLGITDHMYSSFDAVLRTLRHMLELYTPGYPNNIVSRLNALFDIIKNAALPFTILDPQSRMQIYEKMHALGNALVRFDNVLYQLSRTTNEIKKEMSNTRYSSSGADKFLKTMMSERPNIHLVIPFATLCVDGLVDLKLRGFEPDDKNPVETTEENGLKLEEPIVSAVSSFEFDVPIPSVETSAHDHEIDVAAEGDGPQESLTEVKIES